MNPKVCATGCADGKGIVQALRCNTTIPLINTSCSIIYFILKNWNTGHRVNSTRSVIGWDKVVVR